MSGDKVSGLVGRAGDGNLDGFRRLSVEFSRRFSGCFRDMFPRRWPELEAVCRPVCSWFLGVNQAVWPGIFEGCRGGVDPWGLGVSDGFLAPEGVFFEGFGDLARFNRGSRRAGFLEGLSCLLASWRGPGELFLRAGPGYF